MGRLSRANSRRRGNESKVATPLTLSEDRLRVNDKAVSDEKLMLTSSDLTPDGVLKMSLGKKKHVLLKPR